MEELKNKRGKFWYKVGYKILDTYAAHLGSKASLVYIFLKSYQNKKSRYSWPSEQLIADKLDINRRTVIRALKILEAHRLIRKEKVRIKGRWPHNSYYITYSDEWLIQPCDKNAYHHVTKSHTKEIKYKNNNP